MKKIIVIGASAASVAFISKLRTFDQQSEIICFSGEVSFPYNRCFLADFLTGEQTEQQLGLKNQDFFEKNNVDLRLNCWVSKIDTNNKKICASGVWHDYDYLFLGMGTQPVMPKFMHNFNVSGIFNFHSLSDMHQIKKFIADRGAKTAVVVGAGLNGVEAASSLVDLGLTVNLVQGSGSMLSGHIDQEIAQWLSDLVRQAGLNLITGRVVQVDQKEDKILNVTLDCGMIVPSDMIIVTAGSQVNSNLLHETGIALQEGSVLVDQHLKTNIEGVFAGGDICIVPDMITKKLTRSTTWADAMLQGLCAATNLGPMPRSYPGMLGLRDSYFFGAYFYACGQTVHHDLKVQRVIKIDQQNLKAFYLQEEQLIGFVLIGDISGLSDYKMWYVTRKKVKSPDF